jgi:hypothetical protein
MDFGDIGANIPTILTVVGLILLQFFLRRRRKPEVTHREIAQGLLTEVRLDQALAESFHLRRKPKKFEVVSWQLNKTKLDFLDQPLQVALSDAFTTIEDFNRQIDAAKKHKSASYMINVDVGKIKGPLSKSKQGLEEWLQLTTGTNEPPPKYPGMLDGLFGGR